MGAKNMHMPQPSTLRLLGNLATRPSDGRIELFMELAKEFGPVFRMSLLGRNIVMVSGQKEVDEVCDETRFAKTLSTPLRLARQIAGDSLFTTTSDEPNWGIAHRVLMPAFGLGAMHTYFPMMLEVADQLIAKWQRNKAQNEVKVVEDMTRLTFDTIALCGFGTTFNSFAQEEAHPFVAAMNRALEELQKRTARPSVQTKLMFNTQLQFDKDKAELFDTVDKVIQARRVAKPAAGAKKDLLSLMMEGVDKQTGKGLSDENIRYQILTFLIAGHETTSGLLSFALYFLVKNPQFLAKARREVDHVWGAKPDQRPEFSDIAKLSYTSQILKEALRLWPTAPAFALAPIKETTIGGYSVSPSDTVVVLAPSLHRDPDVWGAQPELFNPEHFLPENEAKRPPNSFKPFGNGMRACIGSQFAMQEAILVLGMVIHRFELIDHTDYQLHIKQALTIKPYDLRLKVMPRQAGKGLAAVTSIAPKASAVSPQWSGTEGGNHKTPFTVLYGSNMGTSEEFACRLAADADAQGYEASVSELDSAVGSLPTNGVVVIVSASYNGKAPDNATKFLAWLKQNSHPQACAGVRFVVFGCGNKDWTSSYQAVPQQLDEGLAAAGAVRLAPRGEGDARQDLGGDFKAWMEMLWPTLKQAFGITTSSEPVASRAPLYDVAFIDAAPESTYIKAFNAIPLRICRNVELQQIGSTRSTRHIEFALSASTSYRVGDHLGIVPRNPTTLIDRVLARFKLQAESLVMLRATAVGKTHLPTEQPITLRDLLANFIELQDVAGRDDLATLAKYTECPPEKVKLLALAETIHPGDVAQPMLYAKEVAAKRLSILDLLEQFRACELPFNVFLELLPPLKPRYYSISSSPLVNPGICSITVGVVDAPSLKGEGRFHGVCSTLLAGLGLEEKIHGFVREASPQFHLPDNAETPIIMVGPGTGFGPFRGFLQERAAQILKGSKVGEALLFYGCRHPEEDQIYREELQAHEQAGHVKVHYAFSLFDSDHAKRAATNPPPNAGNFTGEFVQDQLLKQSAAVRRLLEQGAHFYVCGDASRMEPAVRAALLKVITQGSGYSEQQAEQVLQQMEQSGRYAKDVWAPALSR